MAMERMLGGLSTRHYRTGLEPVGEAVEESSRSTSKSAVSRKFVAMTETALTDLLAKDLTDLDLVALMIDGVYFAEHLCVVALGIDIDGTKHPLGLIEGSTENTTVVKTLLDRMRRLVRPVLAAPRPLGPVEADRRGRVPPVGARQRRAAGLVDDRHLGAPARP